MPVCLSPRIPSDDCSTTSGVPIAARPPSGWQKVIVAESGGGAVARIVRQLQPAGHHSASVPVLEGVERSAAGSSTEGARTSRSSGMGKVLEVLLPHAPVMPRLTSVVVRDCITHSTGAVDGGGCCGIGACVEAGVHCLRFTARSIKKALPCCFLYSRISLYSWTYCYKTSTTSRSTCSDRPVQVHGQPAWQATASVCGRTATGASPHFRRVRAWSLIHQTLGSLVGGSEAPLASTILHQLMNLPHTWSV